MHTMPIFNNDNGDSMNFMISIENESENVIFKI